jgi:transposase
MVYMYIRARQRKGYEYYSIVEGKRSADQVKQKQVLNIGRLDRINENVRLEIEQKILSLNVPDIIRRFRMLLFAHGYPFPTVQIEDMAIENVEEYGPVVAQHCIWERLEISEIINRFGLRVGGNVPLGTLTEIQVIHRNCDPGSREKTARWYPKTALPYILKVPMKRIYSRILLRSLDYLQPKYTVPMQIEIYNRIKEEYEIEPTRADIDITAVHFEGNKCVIAEFGYSPPKQRGKKQIVVCVAVDQYGIPMTHIVFPGSKTGKKTLKRMDRILREGFAVEKCIRVGDRAISTKENISYMDRKKESYLMALTLNNKECDIANEAIKKGKWTQIDDDARVAEIEKRENGRDKKYLVGINAKNAENQRMDRENRISDAKDALRKLRKSIARGKIKSRKERDSRIGHILKGQGVQNYLWWKGAKKGISFNFGRLKDNIDDAAHWDGVFVIVTTETYLTANELLESYRERDRIEKAIRTLKDVLKIEPAYVHERKQVIGHVFICVLAYQIRAVMRHILKKNEVDMSIDEAFEVLERLKVVDITIRGDKTKVYRKLTALNGQIMTLVETFKICDEDIELLPTWGFKYCRK